MAGTDAPVNGRAHPLQEPRAGLFGEGGELGERLSGIEETKGIPVVFVTALSEAGDEARGLEVDALPGAPLTVSVAAASSVTLPPVSPEIVGTSSLPLIVMVAVLVNVAVPSVTSNS